MTRVRRPCDRRGVTAPAAVLEVGHLVCGRWRPNSYDHRRGDAADTGNAGEGQRPQRHVPDPRQRAQRRPAVDGGAPARGSARPPTPPRWAICRSLVVGPADRQRAGSAAQPQEAPSQLHVAAAGACGRRSPAVLVVLGIAIGWGLYGNTSSPLSFTVAIPARSPTAIAPKVLTPPKQLQSLGGLTGLLEQMRQTLRRHRWATGWWSIPTTPRWSGRTPTRTAGS